MPISRREFEQGRIDPSRFLIELFRDNPDSAFSFTELQSMVSLEANSSQEELRELLTDLERRGWIESRELGGLRYYMRRPMGFRPR